MTRKRKILIMILSVFSVFVGVLAQGREAYAATKSSTIPFIVLSRYQTAVDVGDSFYIAAVTSTGALPTWKSSSSSVASVNTYGYVTAKKPGTALITAKIKNAEASCKVTVRKTTVTISETKVSIEKNGYVNLKAKSSTGSAITWKSSKKSVATVSKDGKVVGVKPGTTEITASTDGGEAVCKVTVKTPTIKLNKTTATVYRLQKVRLEATVSSHTKPTFKSNKSSVATVTSLGIVTAVGHGTATITVKADGVEKTCTITVKQPTVKLNHTQLSMKTGDKATLQATVSSGNKPVFTSSKPEVVSVTSTGELTAIQKGSAVITAAEDGVKAKCTVKVTDK
jgi:uncharacterized protein YjdB